MKAHWILTGALALATLGMILVVLATTSRGLFFAGVYLLDAALIGLLVAGIMSLLTRPERV